jgi:mevalonate kinase
MAKRPDLSHNQQRIVNRYYANKDAIVETRLGDVVSELYIATAEGKQAPIKRLWNSARAALKQKGVPEAQIDRIVDAQDLTALAALAGQVSR